MQIDNRSCMLEILDTAGQEEYIALRDQWIRGGQGILLVYSISSRYSFERINTFHECIQRVTEKAAANSLHSGTSDSHTPAPVLLVGNKCDRFSERQVPIAEGEAMAKQLGWGFMETSAKTPENVQKAFCDVVRMIRRQAVGASPVWPEPQHGETSNEERHRLTPRIRWRSWRRLQSQQLPRNGHEGRPLVPKVGWSQLLTFQVET